MADPIKGPNHPYGMDYEGYELFEKEQKAKARSKKEYSDEEEFEFEDAKPKSEQGNGIVAGKSDEVEVIEVNDSGEEPEVVEVIEVKDSSEEEVSVAVAGKPNKEEVKDVVVKCRWCEHNPCFLDVIYADMMAIGEGMEDDVEDNKEIRFALYKFAARKLYGRLGRGNRKGIPHCIMMEIHDAYPNRHGVKYVGFKQYADDADNEEDTDESSESG
jgi:hypothetical protein